MEVVHEHRHGLVTRQLHAHLGRHARIGNVGGRAVEDTVRADMRHAGGLERPAPASVVLAKGQVLVRVVGRRQDIGAAFPARCPRKQPIGFRAHGLGHAAGLAVRPDHAAVLEVEPSPFEWTDFGALCGKLELQADRQRDDVVLQSFGLQLVQVAIDRSAQFAVHDEPGFLARREHREMAAWVRAVQGVAPHFGQIEHLA